MSSILSRPYTVQEESKHHHDLVVLTQTCLRMKGTEGWYRSWLLSLCTSWQFSFYIGPNPVLIYLTWMPVEAFSENLSHVCLKGKIPWNFQSFWQSNSRTTTKQPITQNTIVLSFTFPLLFLIPGLPPQLKIKGSRSITEMARTTKSGFQHDY